MAGEIAPRGEKRPGGGLPPEAMPNEAGSSLRRPRATALGSGQRARAKHSCREAASSSPSYATHICLARPKGHGPAARLAPDLAETTAPGTLLAIEEPENGVHPSRARALLDILREAAAEQPDEPTGPQAQVILTSHSPAVLAALLDRPRDIVFIDMVRDGAGPRRTRARPLAAPDASDRGEHAVSRREIERVLETATPVEGGGP